jgi:hypothetical protein
MTPTIPILTSLVPCAGIGCGRHECANYRAMEGSDPMEPRIATCVGLEGHKLAARLAPQAGVRS